ncbi:MAG: hypothetical protein U0X91_20620 [Spirosomataceae bacterium]
MFDIRLEGTSLDRFPNTQLALERFNPLFDFGTLQGAKMYRFAVPFSKKNDAAFGHAYDPRVVRNPRLFSTDLYADGDLIERGNVYLEKVTDTGYELSFGSSFGSFFGDLTDVSLRKINFGSEALPGSHTAILTSKNSVAGDLMYCLPTVKNADFYGTNTVAGFDGLVNKYVSGAYTSACPKVPMIGLIWVLKKLGELCGFTLDGPALSHTAMQRVIFYNTFCLDSATTLNYANHLPDITVRQLILALRMPPFGIVPFIDQRARRITLRFTEELLATPTSMDLTERTYPKVLPGSLTDRRLELNWQLDSGDGLMKVVPTELDKYTAAANGDATLFSLTGLFSTLKIDSGTGYPTASQAGISPQFGQLNNSFSPRFLFWEGMISSVPSADVSYSGTLLSFTGTNNLRVKFWNRFETWRARTYPIQVRAQLTANQLTRLDFHRRAGQEIAVHIKGVDYLVQKITAPLPSEKQYSTLELWKR